MKLFGRRYRLELGNEIDGIVIDQLRISFDIEKTINSKPNTGTIKVWNLNASHRQQLLSGDYDRARLWAGYRDGFQLLYSGDIVAAKLERAQLDQILSLSCGSGDRDYHLARVNTTLAAGSTDSEVLEATLDSMTRTSRGIIAIEQGRELPRARVIQGQSRDVLSRLSTWHNADWSIQDDELLMLPRQQALLHEWVLLSEQTGLIGVPEPGDNNILELVSLLNPRLRVGGMIRLQSLYQHLNGHYKILSLKYSGDILGNNWFCQLKVEGGAFMPALPQESGEHYGKRVVADAITGGGNSGGHSG